MRWFWIDRFTEFVRYRRATAVKAVTLSEEHLHDHFPGAAIMPTSLIIEGIAQTAGLLVADAIDFKQQVVLAKVSSATFTRDAVPGDTLEYRVRITDSRAGGTMVMAESRLNGEPHGEAELYFGQLETGLRVPRLFSTPEMLRWLDSLRLFDVAVYEDGTPAPRNESL